jgi:ATP-dependent DNA helicase RecQ
VSETKDLLFTGLSPEQVAAKRSLKVSTILGHCAELVRRGDLTVAEATRLPEKELHHIESALHALAEDERTRLKPLFEALDGKYDYNILRCVLAGLEG